MTATIHVFLALALVTASIGCSPPSAPAEDEGHGPVRVTVAAAQLVTFERTVRALGTCEALPDGIARVSSLIEGRVVEITVREGASVTEHQVIARLDDQRAHDDLQQAEAEHAVAVAELALLRASPREPDVRAATVERKRAEVAVAVARASLNQLKPLRERDEISEQQLFEAQQRLADAELLHELAQAHHDVVVQGPLSEAVAAGEARIARAEALVRTARTALALHQLVAPRAGVVDRIVAHLGDVVPVGGLVAEVVDQGVLTITTSVAARDVALLREGQEVRVVVPRAARELGHALAGTVTAIGMQASADTGSFPLRVQLTEPDTSLRFGMSVSVTIIVATVRDALAVPSESLVTTDEGPVVFVVRDSKAVAVRPTTIGLERDGLVEIAADIKPGEPVVLRGGYLEPDTPVHVSDDAADESPHR